MAGCGGGAGGSSDARVYCQDVQNVKAGLAGLGNDDLSQGELDKLGTDLHEIADHAPGGARADWLTYADAVDAFNADLKKAGTTMDEASNMDMGSGMSTGGQMDAIMSAFSSLQTVKVANARAGMFDSASKECSISLE